MKITFIFNKIYISLLYTISFFAFLSIQIKILSLTSMYAAIEESTSLAITVLILLVITSTLFTHLLVQFLRNQEERGWYLSIVFPLVEFQVPLHFVQLTLMSRLSLLDLFQWTKYFFYTSWRNYKNCIVVYFIVICIPPFWCIFYVSDNSFTETIVTGILSINLSSIIDSLFLIISFLSWILLEKITFPLLI